VRGGEGFTDHALFMSRNVGGPGRAQIENGGGIRGLARASEIACHQTPDILSERNAQVPGALLRAMLHLGIESDLGT